MIIDENKIKEYVNYHDWVNSPNEWHELWNTSVSVRGVLLENITNEEILVVLYPKSVIRISQCRTAKRNPLIFPI